MSCPLGENEAEEVFSWAVFIEVAEVWLKMPHKTVLYRAQVPPLQKSGSPVAKGPFPDCPEREGHHDSRMGWGCLRMPPANEVKNYNSMCQALDKFQVPLSFPFLAWRG